MKEMLKQKVLDHIDLTEDIDDKQLKTLIETQLQELSKEQYLSLDEKHKLYKEVFYSLRKLDILQDMLEDDTITEIMINGYQNIFVEKKGKLYPWNDHFSSPEKLYQVIQQIVSGANRIVNELNPIVDARLSDGSRVNVMLPPVAIDGAAMTIRKFAKEPMTMEWLRKKGAFNESIENILNLLVKSRYNIFISGGTGSGKTTLLNGLSNCIPKDERVITIEDSAELQLNGIDNLIRLEMRNANTAGQGAVAMKDLIKAALRSRPDRIIVGEVRSEEALDMIQAMNTGHDGSISTGHANSSRDMLKRIETMVCMGVDMPVMAIRGQMAAAIDVIIHLGRLPDGSRKILEIAEITGIEDNTVEISFLFLRNEQGEMVRQTPLKHEKKLKEYGYYDEYQKIVSGFQTAKMDVYKT